MNIWNFTVQLLLNLGLLGVRGATGVTQQQGESDGSYVARAFLRTWGRLRNLALSTLIAILLAILFGLADQWWLDMAFGTIIFVLLSWILAVSLPVAAVATIILHPLHPVQNMDRMFRAYGKLLAGSLLITSLLSLFLVLVPLGAYPGAAAPIFLCMLAGLAIWGLQTSGVSVPKLVVSLVSVVVVFFVSATFAKALYNSLPTQTKQVIEGEVTENLPSYRFNPETREPQRKYMVDSVTGEYKETKNLHHNFDPDTGEPLPTLTPAAYRAIREQRKQEQLTCRGVTMQLSREWQSVAIPGRMVVSPIDGCVQQRFVDKGGNIFGPYDNCPETNAATENQPLKFPDIVHHEARAIGPTATICLQYK